ncbi:MAG: hypothetical protein DRH20_16180 [Deltaproteobacteria bacterium]|nr:MAG: hypothetical protein DRH20_16180 [Deltaproteobacteria bacterium]
MPRKWIRIGPCHLKGLRRLKKRPDSYTGQAFDRSGEIVALGMRSVVAGTLATCMTGAVVGILY